MSDQQETSGAHIGRLIAGKYQVERLLGEGGMGAVYEARHTWTRRKVAVKVLLPHLAADADIVRRFMQEARAATQIAHPNIVEVLDMGQDPTDGTVYLVQDETTRGLMALKLIQILIEALRVYAHRLERPPESDVRPGEVDGEDEDGDREQSRADRDPAALRLHDDHLDQLAARRSRGLLVRGRRRFGIVHFVEIDAIRPNDNPQCTAR
jgi:hypothetical protein